MIANQHEYAFIYIILCCFRIFVYLVWKGVLKLAKDSSKYSLGMQFILK
jgi:hypothetical protein